MTIREWTKQHKKRLQRAATWAGLSVALSVLFFMLMLAGFNGHYSTLRHGMGPSRRARDKLLSQIPQINEWKGTIPARRRCAPPKMFGALRRGIFGGRFG